MKSPVYIQNEISAPNSGTTALAAGATFTGTACGTLDAAYDATVIRQAGELEVMKRRVSGERGHERKCYYYGVVRSFVGKELRG